MEQRREKKAMKRSSMVFWSGEANKGAVEPVSSLLGRKVTAVAGGDAALLALADDGIYTAPDGTLLSCLEFRTAAVGRSVVVGVTQSGGLYSWGTGDMGELGLGPTYTSVDEPKYINYASNFVSVSAGATHSTAVDDKGNAYAWGQNFDRQLGLYIKPLDEMQKLRPTASVEDLLFTPRFLPFSLANPVTKIACGDAFTIVATKDGALWSWGAGECGQLATGRCTKRELPQRVVFPSDATIVDVACGSAHVLALSKTSQLYTWGMNKRGQLGLDDTKTRHAPCEVNETCGAVFAKVYAHGHSSAALDVTGQLYTWGSTTNQRLMRWRRRRSLDGADTAFSGGGSSHCLRPGHAAAFRGMVVDSFAFSASASAALVYTNIQSLSPLLGPCKGPQQVTFKGYGLWDSDRIIVKFAHREGLGQSRSCPARFDAARGVVVCKPPKLVDPGFYNVALAMDGVTFQPEVHSFYAHREISATAVTPRLIDLRGSKESTVTTTIRGLSVYPDVIEGEAESAQLLWPRESDLSFFVKLVVLCSAPGANSPTASEVIMPAKLLPLPVLEMSTVLDGGAGGESAASFGLGGGSASLASLESVELQNEVSVAPTLQPITADRQVECVVDFSALGPPGSLIVIRTAVGINGIDFGPPTPELAPIICHSFQPLGASPCCCPLEYPDLDDADSSSRVITVVGSSFIPTSKLPPGTSIEAVVSAELPAARKGAKPTRVERTVAVECDVADALTLVMPTLSEMLDPSLPVSSSRPGTQGGALSRPGSQERLEGGDADARPPSQPGSVKSGAGSTPRELMCKIMFKMVAPAPPVPLSALPDAKKGNSPNKKSPNKAKKAPEPEPVNYLSPEAVSVFLYAPQGCSAGPDLARRRGGGMLVLQGTDKGGFLFGSSDVRVVFSRPDLGLEISVPRSATWMLGLDQEVPVAASAGPGDEGEGHEDEDEGLGLDDAAEGGVVAGGSVAASLHEGSVGSLGELSVKSTASVIANVGVPHKVVVRCPPFFFPRPAPEPALEPVSEPEIEALTIDVTDLSLGDEGEPSDAPLTGAVDGDAEVEASAEPSAESKDDGGGAGAGEGESKDAGAVADGSPEDLAGAEEAAPAAAEEEKEEPWPELPPLLDYVLVKVLLDGRSLVPDSQAARLRLFHTVSLGSTALAVPKGGATAATPVVLPVSAGLVESSRCLVRLRGAAPEDEGADPQTLALALKGLPTASGTITLPAAPAKAEAEAAAEGDEAAALPAAAAEPYVDVGGSEGEVGFILPDPAGLEPVLKGKDRFLFVDLSLDGGETWEAASDSLLQVK